MGGWRVVNNEGNILYDGELKWVNLNYAMYPASARGSMPCL